MWQFLEQFFNPISIKWQENQVDNYYVYSSTNLKTKISPRNAKSAERYKERKTKGMASKTIKQTMKLKEEIPCLIAHLLSPRTNPNSEEIPQW